MRLREKERESVNMRERAREQRGCSPQIGDGAVDPESFSQRHSARETDIVDR
jgi:hypothetical protein